MNFTDEVRRYEARKAEALAHFKANPGKFAHASFDATVARLHRQLAQAVVAGAKPASSVVSKPVAKVTRRPAIVAGKSFPFAHLRPDIDLDSGESAPSRRRNTVDGQAADFATEMERVGAMVGGRQTRPLIEGPRQQTKTITGDDLVKMARRRNVARAEAAEAQRRHLLGRLR